MNDIIFSYLLVSLYVSYAKRALARGGKGEFVTEQLKSENPDLYEFVMKEARDAVTKLNKKGS